MNDPTPISAPSRRSLLQSLSAGFGYMAFAGLSTQAARRDAGPSHPLQPKQPHHAPRAKRVIFCCMRGGPSHVDTFDYKPALKKDEGKKYQNRRWLPSPWEFKPRGQSGLMISELFPHLSEHADNLCLINGMYADVPSHPECFVQLHTGSFQFVRPSMGAWVLYGLGTENENLPGFITIKPPSRVGGAQNYGSAFLPAMYQGTRIGDFGRPLTGAGIDNLKPRAGLDQQRRQIDLVQDMNRDLLARKQVNPQIEGLIESYELAFRMQTAVPDVLDISREPKRVRDMYGIDDSRTGDFGKQCLLARRFAEAGVRFIELSHASWDQHNGLRNNLSKNCGATDQPLGALLTDLKQRGMLEDTLVVWGGEFGRTPHVKKDDGRDHNNKGFTFWMAGGGVKGGITHGATDPHGVAAVEERTHFHDLHATMLHLLGLDHERLTYRYAGRDFRLTDVYGNVVHEIVA